MLKEWHDNLAIMAANRTNGDKRVIMHLGDCLWRHRDEICGAHICYLVANASFEPFSPSARLCLIGADHSSSRSSVSLASSASMEPISDNTRRSNMPARSISEPDFRPAQIISPAKGTPNRGVFTSFMQRAMGLIKTPSKEENGAPISMSPERPQPTPERPQPVVSGIPPMPPSSNQYAARACQNVRSRYVDTFNKGSITPSKTSSDSPPLFGVVPKASAKPLAPARFFVPAAAAAAAPDINSNHSVDPSSAPAFVSDTAFSNGNGAFAQPVVQDMRNNPGPMPDHLSSSSSPAIFYSNHYPAALSTVSLLPPPALEVTPPVMVEQQQQNQHQESSIHRHHHQQSGTVGFEAASSSGVFATCKRWNCKSHSTKQCSKVVVVEGGIWFGWGDSLEPTSEARKQDK
ncbi:hypothetical protein SELMODRAFT_431525 [Selaginella moellendorffii]|uniref:Sec16 Sec23-binding domain-containing protein n=1 Tax=Selaginella moellendorffii TaxID=88036 RepID=D8TCY3_SELML|nr:hypothetical protein SELMODRAFT_431525 [Selaginella moellendorffii]